MDVWFIPKRFKLKPCLSPLSVLLISLTVAAISMASLYQLNQMVERSSRTKLLLVKMQEQTSRLNSLEWEGIAKREIDANLAEELAENREATDQILDALRQTLQQNQWDQLLVKHERYKAKTEAALAIIATQDATKLLAIDEDEIDRVYDQLYAEISSLEQIYEAQREQGRTIADIGTGFLLILAALSISNLFWRFSRDLWTKNQDLTKTIQELQQAQYQLIQQEKMAALGQLIAGVAHEINNPLGAIQASADNTYKALHDALAELPHLYQRLSLDEQSAFFELINQAVHRQSSTSFGESRSIKRELTAQLKAYEVNNARYIADLLIDMNIHQERDIAALLPLLQGAHTEWTVDLAYNLTCAFTNNQIILKAVSRSAKIVFALKNYARSNQTSQKQQLQVTEGLETVVELYRNQIKQNIELVRDYQSLPDLWGYPDELVQVWTNLIHNAIQAMQGQGTLTLVAQQQQNGIEVIVKDTGAGIPLGIQQKIFEPFFTTKTSGEGSGLGLYISQKIIDKHQGQMTVESCPGCTQFKVWLPVGSI